LVESDGNAYYSQSIFRATKPCAYRANIGLGRRLDINVVAGPECTTVLECAYNEYYNQGTCACSPIVYQTPIGEIRELNSATQGIVDIEINAGTMEDSSYFTVRTFADSNGEFEFNFDGILENADGCLGEAYSHSNIYYKQTVFKGFTPC
jgi:hypothetical protein